MEKIVESGIEKIGGTAMNKLFEKTDINGLSLANRFIFSATWDGCADDKGFCTQRNIDMLVERAHSGVGLIITGMAFVQADGKAAPWQLGVHGDEFVPDLAEMAQAVHNAQGKVILQLAHGGVLCALADTAMGVVFATMLEEGESLTTLELKINYLKPVWKGKLLALGKVVKKGRMTGLVECDIVDEDEQLVARASSTYMAISGDHAKNRTLPT